MVWKVRVAGNERFLGANVHHCELANVFQRGFEPEAVQGTDFILDRVFYDQSGIQTSFESGRLRGRTYVLPLVRKGGAI